MVNFKKLTDKAKDAVEKRGGSEALKSDAKEVGGILKGKGSLKEKAAKAREAVSDPGKRGPDHQAGDHEAGAEARQHGGGANKPDAAGKPDAADAVGVTHAQPPVDSADEADKRG